MTDFDDAVARAERTSFRAGIASLFGLIVILSALAYGTHQLHSLQSELTALRSKKQSVQHDIDTLSTQRDALQRQLDDLRPKFEVAQLAASAASKPRNARIQYFPKDADGMRVEAALKDLGFQVSKGQGNPELRRQSTNAIFFGPDVKLEDLKVVAVALVKGGASLRVIRPIQRTAPDKGNLIEIGTTGSVGNNPPLTVEKIQSARTLTDFS